MTRLQMSFLMTTRQWLKALVLFAWLGLSQGQALAQVTVTYFHNDISGTPLAATDSAGNLVWKETYRPYGERLTNSPASSGNGVWFTSKPQDARTGLVYMGARYYDPVIGRFMGTDPVGFVEGNVHSVNRYAYANNNPYRYVDPDGKYADLAIEAVSLTVGFHSLMGNWRESNWSGAAVDAGGIVADVVGAVIPGIPGMAGLGIKASREAAEVAAKGGKNYVEGFRAVSKAEADDIARHGFRPDPTGRSMGDKWFSETRQGAEQFRKTYPDLQEVVKTRVPKDVYDRSFKHPNIDNTGPGFCVQCADLSRLPKP